jgi:two-component system, HptB-dependent secretion and biofilm response regulator
MEAGHEVVEAEDGQQACEKFEGDPSIDVVIMDINMPVMNGLEACAKIDKF